MYTTVYVAYTNRPINTSLIYQLPPICTWDLPVLDVSFGALKFSDEYFLQ